MGNRKDLTMIARHLVLLFGALVWFGAMYGLAANGAFVSARDEPPLTLAAAFLTHFASGGRR